MAARVTYPIVIMKWCLGSWTGSRLYSVSGQSLLHCFRQLIFFVNKKHAMNFALFVFSVISISRLVTLASILDNRYHTGDPLHSRAADMQPCNVNTHSRAHCSPGARLCEQWGHGCVNNGARLCASARLCRGSPVLSGLYGMCNQKYNLTSPWRPLLGPLNWHPLLGQVIATHLTIGYP